MNSPNSIQIGNVIILSGGTNTRGLQETLTRVFSSATNASQPTLSWVVHELQELREKTDNVERKLEAVTRGISKLIDDSFANGLRRYTNWDFAGASEHFGTAIGAIESMGTSNGVSAVAGLSIQQIGVIYNLAGSSAEATGNTTLALHYSEKAFMAKPSADGLEILSVTLQNIGIRRFLSNSRVESFGILSNAVYAWELSEVGHKNIPPGKREPDKLYFVATVSAQEVRSNSLALGYATKAVKLNPVARNIGVLITVFHNLGYESLQRQDCAKAFDWFSKAFDTYETNKNVDVFFPAPDKAYFFRWLARGATCVRSNALANAHAQRALVDESPASFDLAAMTQFNVGGEKFDRDDYPGAYHDFKMAAGFHAASMLQLIVLHTNSQPELLTREQVGTLYAGVAMAAQRLGYREEACDFARRAVDAAPDGFNYSLFATTLGNLGRRKDARSAIEKAYQLSPTDPQIIGLRNDYKE